MHDAVHAQSPLAERLYPPAISLREIWPYALLAIALLVQLYFVGADQGATSLVRATTSTSGSTMAVTSSASPATERPRGTDMNFTPVRALSGRGMLAGLCRGVLAPGVSRSPASPPIDEPAIAFESAQAKAAGEAAEPAVVCRGVQRTVGLLTAASSSASRRRYRRARVRVALGRDRAREPRTGPPRCGSRPGRCSSVYVVPFLKYPANPPSVGEDVDAFLDDLLDGARVVVARLLGGRRAWPEGVAALRSRCARDGVALLLLAGEAEPDAELAEPVARAPRRRSAQAGEYLRHGGVDNAAQPAALPRRHAACCEGHGFAAPRARCPTSGSTCPAAATSPIEEAVAAHDPGRPTVGLVFYRSHRVTGNTAFVDALVAALDAAGADTLCVWAYSLRVGGDGIEGRVAALEILHGRIDALVTTVLASGGSTAADAAVDGHADWSTWRADALAALDVPVIQAVCATSSRAAWAASPAGLTPLDAAIQVTIPRDRDRAHRRRADLVRGAAQGGLAGRRPRSSTTAPTASAARRLARLAVPPARSCAGPTARAKEARPRPVQPSRPARADRQRGRASTPRPAPVALLTRLREEAGTSARDRPAALQGLSAAAVRADPTRWCAAGELRRGVGSRGQLASATRSRHRRWDYRRGSHAARFGLREAVERHASPRRRLFLDTSTDPDGDTRLQRSRTCWCSCQPPAARSQPGTIYHDRTSPPSPHYLAAYRWIGAAQADRVLAPTHRPPRKARHPGVAARQERRAVAAAPPMPRPGTSHLFPFLVNDPSEGAQASAARTPCIIDHLVPPMMRAGRTYRRHARLEQLLDEHADTRRLDPAKCPASPAADLDPAAGRPSLDHDLGSSDRPTTALERVRASSISTSTATCARSTSRSATAARAATRRGPGPGRPGAGHPAARRRAGPAATHEPASLAGRARLLAAPTSRPCAALVDLDRFEELASGRWPLGGRAAPRWRPRPACPRTPAMPPTRPAPRRALPASARERDLDRLEEGGARRRLLLALERAG